MKYRLISGNRQRFANHILYLVLFAVIFLGFYFKPLISGYVPVLGIEQINLELSESVLERSSGEIHWQNSILSGLPIYQEVGWEAKIKNFFNNSVQSNTQRNHRLGIAID